MTHDFSLAVKSFIIHNEKLLLLRRNFTNPHKPGGWDIPGGRLDKGENPFDGLRRETKEETGLEITILHPLGVQHFVRDDQQRITMLIFLCTPEHTQITLSPEHDLYQWAPLTPEHIRSWLHHELGTFNTLFKHQI